MKIDKIAKQQTCLINLKMEKANIYYISWILDASEGLGFLETTNPKEGLVTITTSESQLKYVIDLLKNLFDIEKLKIEIIEIISKY
ncbi:MAG: DUF4911 domain-containing protein [Synergistaceae bacterium]